jgi:putative hydrolase
MATHDDGPDPELPRDPDEDGKDAGSDEGSGSVGFGGIGGPRTSGGTGSSSGFGFTGNPQGPSGGAQNPFAGTPLEQLMGAFAGGGAMPDLGAMMAQMQQLMTPQEGNVNWGLATQVARQTIASKPDPSPHEGERSAVADAIRLAEHWLDTATDIPAATTGAAVWSRAEWIEYTTPTWKRLVEPIAEHVVAAMGQALPEEARAMAGPLIGLMSQAGGAMFGQQIGRAIGELSGEVMSSTDIGLPLAPDGTMALLPANVRAFSEGLDQTLTDVMLYVALRECAHQRLFAHAPWLRAHLFGAVEEFGRGTAIDLSRIEDALSNLDPTNIGAIQEALSGGLFEPQQTGVQQAALVRLETVLALVEGWVDEVVAQATTERMPAAGPLQEAMRRRRAAGGPAEQTFAALVGLQLRPRRLRDAAALWGALRDREGPSARDAVWAHPDLLPTAADLDDPMGFAAGERAGEALSDGEDFDTALAALLDRPTESTGGPDTDPAEGSGDGDTGTSPGPDDEAR